MPAHFQYPPGFTAGRTATPVRVLSKQAHQPLLLEGATFDGTACYDYGNTSYEKIIRGGCFVARNSSTLKWAPVKRTKANGDGSATTALVVDDATHFRVGDSVVVGANAAQVIVAIPTVTTITLTSAITWKDNDPVFVDAWKTARGVLVSDEVNLYHATTPATYVDASGVIAIRGYVDQDKLLGDYAAILEDPDSVLNLVGIQYDDYQLGVDTMPAPFRPFNLNKTKSVSANYTITASDNGTLFVVKAAATFTLPTLAVGLSFGFFNEADVNMTIAGPSSPDNIITFNDLAADSVAYSTSGEKIGAACVVGSNMDATKWWHFHLCKHTLTVA